MPSSTASCPLPPTPHPPTSHPLLHTFHNPSRVLPPCPPYRQVLASQLPAVLVISFTLAAGVGLDVEPCRAIGAIFAFLYVGTKLGELDWKR